MEESECKSTNTGLPSTPCSEDQQPKPMSNTAKENTDCADIVKSELMQKIQNLKEASRKLEHDFSNQRAKMMELFKQKERELDDLRTDLAITKMKAEEEITSLQQLVQDTMDESTICKADLERLKKESIRLWQENRELRQGLGQPPTQELSSLAPQMLSQVKKTLVRKLGGDSNSVLGTSFIQDQPDDSKNKSEGKYANEDAEVLGSIVTQLQEEMKVLKEKLRETDDKLHSKVDTLTTHSIDLETDQSIAQTEPCANCVTYENKIVLLREKSVQDAECIEGLKKQLEEYNKDLEKEASLRNDLENQWQEKREAHKNEVHTLREQVTGNERQLLDLQQKFLETKDEVMRQLLRVSSEREKVNKQMEILQADNDYLSGQYLATAEEIENQCINLPNKVEELHELILKQQQELIKARLGCDYEKKRCNVFAEEAQLLRDQLELSSRDHAEYKKKYQSDSKSLQDRITEHMKTLQRSETEKLDLERKQAELNRQISEVRVENLALQEKNENIIKEYEDAKAKIKNLQDDLATSVTVQKDFVQLSQKLQISLEQLRVADTEVRWQDEDDVSVCPNCEGNFTVTVRKMHCRHCGRIYCDKCLTKEVPSGPRNRPARVCDICHTLLLPNTAPYFSEEPSGSQQPPNTHTHTTS